MKFLLKLSVFSLFLFLFVSCSSPKTATEQTSQQQTDKEMSIKEQVQNGAFVVDVRTPDEFSGGSVEGAVNIPLDEVEKRIKEFEGKPSVIVFCRSGNRSGQAKAILESAGIKNVTNGINTDHMNTELGK